MLMKKIIVGILSVLILAFLVNGLIEINEINQKHSKREQVNHNDDVPVP